VSERAFSNLIEIDNFYVDPDVYVAEWEGKSRCLPAALTYAAMGWAVFPAPRGKRKSHKSAEYSGGRNWGATVDTDEIRRDFARWPEANIGIPTGADNGFWVLDADTIEGHGVDGIASLRALEAQHGKLPDTLTAESPSGSLHYYFKWPKDCAIRNSASAIAPGIDVRGEGGICSRRRA
jgi:putative DNA primase/helicase